MASVLLQNFGEMLMTFPALKMSHFPCMFYSINSCLKWYNSIYTHRTNMKLFILSHTLVLIKKIKGNKETSLVYFCYQSSNINCQKGNSYCEIAHIHTCTYMFIHVYIHTYKQTKYCVDFNSEYHRIRLHTYLANPSCSYVNVPDEMIIAFEKQCKM